MDEYVRGLLVSNKPGAQVPGSSRPVDRWLVIHTLGGMRIRVFDWLLPATGSDRLLSEQEGIREGNTYTFILSELTHALEKGSGSTPVDPWSGTLIDPAWILPPQTYLAVDPQNMGTFEGVLVETILGQVVISRDRLAVRKRGKRLPHPPLYQQGDVLRWGHIRFDLLAILA